jgi:hypothetical protein
LHSEELASAYVFRVFLYEQKYVKSNFETVNGHVKLSRPTTLLANARIVLSCPIKTDIHLYPLILGNVFGRSWRP